MMMPQQEVYSMISSLEHLTGLGVCFYDLTRFFSYHYGKLEKQYTGHYCEFCKAVRELPGGREACIKNDTVQVNQLAQSYKRPFFHLCHIGLCEYIVPVMRQDQLIGIFFVGQCRIESETNFNELFEKIQRLQGERNYFQKRFESLPIISREKLWSAGKLADLSFQCLVSQKKLEVQEDTMDLADMAKQYISSNYMNHISLSHISSLLHVHPSYLSRMFKERTGVNLSDYLTNERIEHAKRLLACTNIPIAHISFNVGFADQNYFTRIFKRITAQTPREYRNHERKQTAD